MKKQVRTKALSPRQQAEPLPYLEDWLLSLQTNNYSPETVYNYERDLKVFEEFLNELGLTTSSVDKKTIERYKAYLASRDRRTCQNAPANKRLKSYSLNRMLSSLRAYLRYLIAMDYPTPLPPEAVKLVKNERKHPQVAELSELVRLIESPTAIEKNKQVALRNRAILEVLFATGLRISELVSLKRSQIDDSGRIFVMGKGKKERFVYLTPRSIRHIDAYLKTRRDDHPALFIPYRGENASKATSRISTNYLQMKIKCYREQLRINVPTSAHSLRHGFATYLAESGANPAAIQVLLGHESLDTTTRYVHASDKYAETTHHKFHPLRE
ncbi:MAG: tyrosine-type recombinase/integrase [Candidatus Kerfeldbacteria bacterium]|nr:tyrosine-type recombinase/integrase [Candidatus Kerfeldbacteria bacterium]